MLPLLGAQETDPQQQARADRCPQRLCFRLTFIGVSLLYSTVLFLLHSKRSQPHIDTSPLRPGLPSHSGPRRALNRVPCAAQQVLIIYLFYIQDQQCTCVNPKLPVSPTLPFIPWYPCLWRGCGGKGILTHCRWECKWTQPLWKTVWSFLKQLKIQLAYDPTIPALGIHPEKAII